MAVPRGLGDHPPVLLGDAVQSLRSWRPLPHLHALARLGRKLTAHATPTRLKALGVVLVSAGVLAVGASPNAPLKATLWALSIGICIASYSLVDALGARISGNAALYVGWTSGVMGVPMVAFAMWRRGTKQLVADAGIAPWRGILDRKSTR